MRQVTVVKIGGKIIDDAVRLDLFLGAFNDIPGAKILVHGGGNIATETGNRMGIRPNYAGGRRVTDRETLDLVMMVYGGLVNKKIVAALQARGCNAIGLTGADGNAVLAARRAVKEVDYGHVGDVRSEGINTRFLSGLLEQGLTPVLAPLTHDGAGGMLNTNADTIAQETAKAFAAQIRVRLVYCFEKNGVLGDPDDDDSVIPAIHAEDFERLKRDGTVSEGMIPKLENAFSAIGAGVEKVIIGHADALRSLIAGKAGTQIL